LTCLIVVEGVTDKSVIQEIARMIGIKVKVLVARGNRPRKIAQLINAEPRERYSKAIILKDQHRLSESKENELLSRAIREVKHPKKYPVMVKKAIESWILAGMGIHNAEDIDDPVTYLDNIMVSQGKRYIKSEGLVKDILRKNFKLEQTIRNSQTPKRFIDVLRDP